MWQASVALLLLLLLVIRLPSLLPISWWYWVAAWLGGTGNSARHVELLYWLIYLFIPQPGRNILPHNLQPTLHNMSFLSEGDEGSQRGEISSSGRGRYGSF